MAEFPCSDSLPLEKAMCWVSVKPGLGESIPGGEFVLFRNEPEESGLKKNFNFLPLVSGNGFWKLECLGCPHLQHEALLLNKEIIEMTAGQELWHPVTYHMLLRRPLKPQQTTCCGLDCTRNSLRGSAVRHKHVQVVWIG